MEQFFASVLITFFILFAFILSLRFFTIPPKSEIADSEFLNRKYTVFQNEVSEHPTILGAEIVLESDIELVLDVVYEVPAQNENRYVMIVFPDGSDDFKTHYVSMNPGKYTQRVTISFQPDSRFKRRVVTEFLNFYVYKQTETALRERVYRKKAALTKTWAKRKRLDIRVNPTVFRTQ